ncbi:MAG: hypothetical protein II304_12220 [Bacteroidales bacterium]|nr:hypothetical protein [Bacteroidales bacterium]
MCLNLFVKKCNKQLDSVFYGYGTKWLCSEHTEDKENVLFCEKGCRVKAINLNNGWKCDSETAHKYLEQNKVYTVEKLEIDRCISYIELQEFPNVIFNTVHFIRVK